MNSRRRMRLPFCKDKTWGRKTLALRREGPHSFLKDRSGSEGPVRRHGPEASGLTLLRTSNSKRQRAGSRSNRAPRRGHSGQSGRERPSTSAATSEPAERRGKRGWFRSSPRKWQVTIPPITTKTGLAFKKRYFAEWDETCKLAGIEGLHFHDIRGTTVTMLAEAGCSLPEIVSITGHSLRRAQAR